MSKKVKIVQKGGLLVGYGGRGDVYTNPRLPFLRKITLGEIFDYLFKNKIPIIDIIEDLSKPLSKDEEPDESIKDVMMIGSSEVSKVFIDGIILTQNYNTNANWNKFVKTIPRTLFYKEMKLYTELLKRYPTIITEEYFIFPLSFGTIDTKNVNKLKAIYSREWAGLGNSNTKNIFNNNECKYQITFKTCDSVFKYGVDGFFYGIFNLVKCVKNLMEKGLYPDDLKLENIVYDDGSVKIIDWSSYKSFNYMSHNIGNTQIDEFFSESHYRAFNIFLIYLQKFYKHNYTVRNSKPIELNTVLNESLRNKNDQQIIKDRVHVFNGILDKIELHGKKITEYYRNIFDSILELPNKAICDAIDSGLTFEYEDSNEKLSRQNNLLKRITYYSLGFLIFKFLCYCREGIESKNFKVLLDFACECCFQVRFDEEGYYLIPIEILEDRYNTFLQLKNRKNNGVRGNIFEENNRAKKAVRPNNLGSNNYPNSKKSRP